jgi:hypothetical protein
MSQTIAIARKAPWNCNAARTIAIELLQAATAIQVISRAVGNDNRIFEE